MVAVQLHKAEHCAMCGLTEREFQEDPTAYVAQQVTCPWCAMKDTARSAADTDSSKPGATIRLVPRAVFEQLAAVATRAVRPLSARERARQQ